MLANPSPAASQLHELPPSGPACAPNEARRQANQFIGVPVTNRPTGAGGPLCRWDREIRHWQAMGRPDLAEGLQMARARVNLAFGQEPVFVPTDAQRLLYGLTAGLRAGRDGLRTLAAK